MRRTDSVNLGIFVMYCRSPDILEHCFHSHLAFRGVVLNYAEIKEQDISQYEELNILNRP